MGAPEGCSEPQSSTAACNIDDWMQGLDMGMSDREVGRTYDVHANNYM